MLGFRVGLSLVTLYEGISRPRPLDFKLSIEALQRALLFENNMLLRQRCGAAVILLRSEC